MLRTAGQADAEWPMFDSGEYGCLCDSDWRMWLLAELRSARLS